MGTLGFPLSDADVELFIDRYDTDYDGKLTIPTLSAFAFDKDEINKVNQSQALTTTVPLSIKIAKLVNGVQACFMIGHMVLGMLYKKSAMVIVYHGLPIAGSGTVGEWLEKSASPLERKHFFELMFLLSTFEKRLGLQQSQRDSGADGEV